MVSMQLVLLVTIESTQCHSLLEQHCASRHNSLIFCFKPSYAMRSLQDAMLKQYQDEIARLRAQLDATTPMAAALPAELSMTQLQQEPSTASLDMDPAEEAAMRAEIEAELQAKWMTVNAEALAQVGLWAVKLQLLHTRSWECLQIFGCMVEIIRLLAALSMLLLCLGLFAWLAV